MRSSRCGSRSSSSAAALSASLDRDLFLLRLQRLADLLVLQFLQLQQHAPQVALDDLLFDGHLDGGLFLKHRPLPRRVEIQRIDVEAVAARSQQIHFEQLIAEILGEPAHPVAAVAQRDDDLLALHFGGHVHHRRGGSGDWRLLGG